jgi:hypothetical protein
MIFSSALFQNPPTLPEISRIPGTYTLFVSWTNCYEIASSKIGNFGPIISVGLSWFSFP